VLLHKPEGVYDDRGHIAVVGAVELFKLLLTEVQLVASVGARIGSTPSALRLAGTMVAVGTSTKSVRTPPMALPLSPAVVTRGRITGAAPAATSGMANTGATTPKDAISISYRPRRVRTRLTSYLPTRDKSRCTGA
jgi:hypothetical protein